MKTNNNYKNDEDSLGAIFWKNVERLKNEKGIMWKDLYRECNLTDSTRTAKIYNRLPRTANFDRIVAFFDVDLTEFFLSNKELERRELTLDERRDRVIKQISKISNEKLEIIEKIINL